MNEELKYAVVVVLAMILLAMVLGAPLIRNVSSAKGQDGTTPKAGQ